MTALESLIAATAAKRLDLRPTDRHRDTMSVHGDGRDHCDEPPAEQVVHLTKGYSRAHWPDLHPVMWALIVEHQTGISVLPKPLSGHSSDPLAFGQVIQAHRNQ